MYNTLCYHRAGVAQLVEQLTCNQQVVGSIPIASSIYVEGFPSGQREQTVNLPSSTSKVRILLPPPFHRGVEQLVARRAHNPKVAGSSPVPATIFFYNLYDRSVNGVCWCSSVGRAYPW